MPLDVSMSSARALRPFRSYGGLVSAGYSVGKKLYNAYRQGQRQRRSGSRTQTSTRRNTPTQRSVTFQDDESTLYSRRRAPRRFRRRARRSYRRFVSNQIRSLAQKTRLFTTSFDSTKITPTGWENGQSVFSVGLYGGISASNTWGNLFEICNDQGLLTANGKVHFKSAVLDVQIRNTTDAFIPEQDPPPQPLWVDVYTVYCRKEGYQDPGTDWTDGLLNQGNIPTTSTKITPLTVGSTPFDAPGFGSSWLIAKKKRYRISPGESAFLQMRDPKNHVFNSNRFERESSTVRVQMFRGMTKGYLMVIRSGSFQSTSPYALPFQYEILYSQNYKYVVEDSDTAQNAFGS